MWEFRKLKPGGIINVGRVISSKGKNRNKEQKSSFIRIQLTILGVQRTELQVRPANQSSGEENPNKF